MVAASAAFAVFTASGQLVDAASTPVSCVNGSR